MKQTTLTWLEMYTAANVGAARRLSSINNSGIENRRFSEAGDWEVDIIGAIAEKMFAKIRGLYWDEGVNTFKLPDVGTWQVRGTSWRDGHLIVRQRDKADKIALITIEKMTGTQVGWIEIEEAKKEGNGFWRDDKQSWWVPQKNLTLFED